MPYLSFSMLLQFLYIFLYIYYLYNELTCDCVFPSVLSKKRLCLSPFHMQLKLAYQNPYQKNSTKSKNMNNELY